MRKKIDVRDLQLGMYVVELDRPWLDTPFLFQGFELKSQTALQKLQQLCQYVWIDLVRGEDYRSDARDADAAQARMRQLAQDDELIKLKIRQLVEQSRIRRQHRKPYQDRSNFEQEIVRARQIEGEARDMIREAVIQAQRGKSVDISLARQVVGKMADSIVRNPDALICLSQLKDASEYTALHSIRTCIIALAFGRHLALTREELHTLGLGALLHDIGMVKVPQHILDKRTGIDRNEFQTLKNHLAWGAQILRDSGGIPAGAMEMVEQHHERADGEGYLYGLKGDAISPAGYIAGIVDVYDAITSDRKYSEALSAEDALKRMYEWRHKDFKPDLIEEFIRCMGIFPIGSLVELSTGSVGVVITVNRARRLKPKVALVLTPTKKPYSQKVVADLMVHKDIMGMEVKISRVLPTGTYGIQPMDHLVQL